MRNVLGVGLLDVIFLEPFHDLIEGVNVNVFRGRIFNIGGFALAEVRNRLSELDFIENLNSFRERFAGLIGA